MKKITKNQITTIVSAIITILVALGVITSCTNSLFVLKGYGNKVKQDQKIETKADSVSVKVNANKNYKQ
ncbi:hypothetical protein [Sigmofec virus UA08Rod_4510]|uniref:Lipoprotein n=1 Tax=Sigmofec virus UA08Rod_4510 TaxID=2929402 RepID=A0A976R7G9_9VIRU|nr:hypothetical protein [Sigmofec virus UA08Rod_4510]